MIDINFLLQTRMHISCTVKSFNYKGIYRIKKIRLHKITQLLRLTTLIKLSLAHGL